MFKRIVVLQGVRLDQSPRCTRLGTKIAVDWEGDVLLVDDFVVSIVFYYIRNHDVFTGSRHPKLAFMPSEVRWACAVELPDGDVTHFTTSAAILTGGCVTAFGVTHWVGPRMNRSSL